MWVPQPACPSGLDNSFGPWAGKLCRGGFDFTLLFEESILTIPLQCIFLLVLPICVLRLARSDVKVVTSALRPLKAVSPSGNPFHPLTCLTCESVHPFPWLPSMLLFSSFGKPPHQPQSPTRVQQSPPPFLASSPRWASPCCHGSRTNGR